MSRSGYTDDCCSEWAMICWRGAVASAIRGRRGQALLRELLEALDAMPEKKLIAHELESDGQYCALGTVGAKRGLNMSEIDPDEPDQVAAALGVAPALVQEIEYINDEWGIYPHKDDESRWRRVRQWVQEQIKEPGK